MTPGAPPKMPRAMQAKLAALRAAVEALPPYQPGPRPAPEFGPGPTAAQLAALPPGLAAASRALGAALAAPAGVPTWPVANTPGIQAMLDKEAAQGRGRPNATQAHQVVRLVRFVKLGHSITVAAEKAGLPKTTALRVLSGQCEAAHDPAVTAAGVHLPARKPVQKRSTNRQRPERTKGGGVGAPPALHGLLAAAAKEPACGPFPAEPTPPLGAGPCATAQTPTGAPLAPNRELVSPT